MIDEGQLLPKWPQRPIKREFFPLHGARSPGVSSSDGLERWVGEGLSRPYISESRSNSGFADTEAYFRLASIGSGVGHLGLEGCGRKVGDSGSSFTLHCACRLVPAVTRLLALWPESPHSSSGTGKGAKNERSREPACAL